MSVAVAVGKFDALHLGHRALAAAAARCGRPLLVRLDGMAPVLGWAERRPLVSTCDRARVLAAWSVAIGTTIAETALDFARLRQLSAIDFINVIRQELAATALVVGRDFRCGQGRSAGVSELATICASQGIVLEVVPPTLVAGEPASSSRVRAALERGDTSTAEDCLGRPHRLVGHVQRGDGRGRNIGFPTANLSDCDNELPLTGVYAAHVFLPGDDTPRPAAVNIGVQPTIGAARTPLVEAHLIGWGGVCYEQTLALDLGPRIRDERRFNGLDELREQISRDVAAVMVWDQIK